ncbi:hypothetical protein J5N97_013037 [Dioscorea zingiberensis]|uniref:RRM domain-containing protein n=1 Tax=Dioscorea zingiberensis TaxID=325984 RepID=A0A9D5CQI1_9LILI|nr:hypothetical protein J5N97_013037 [Dioscorea zingiberensis]
MNLLSIAVTPALVFSPSKPSAFPPWIPPRAPSIQGLIASKHHHHPVLLAIRCSTSSESSPTPEAHPSRIFIKGLSNSTYEGSLAKAFSHFGEIKRVKIILGKGSKQSLGFAYIWFTCEEDARSAISEMDGKFFDGRFISVMMANPESPTKQAN